MTSFRYFAGPRSDMSGWEQGPVRCAFCGHEGEGFSLGLASCDSLDERERRSLHGCAGCLARGRFAFDHNTELGELDERGLTRRFADHREMPPSFRREALEELRRTPEIASWQYEPWLTHCDDFMSYIGTWQPADFVRHAPDGDGKALFLAMTRDPDEQHLWDEATCDGDPAPDDWHATYYVYRCLHCGALAGNWDCD